MILDKNLRNDIRINMETVPRQSFSLVASDLKHSISNDASDQKRWRNMFNELLNNGKELHDEKQKLELISANTLMGP